MEPQFQCGQPHIPGHPLPVNRQARIIQSCGQNSTRLFAASAAGRPSTSRTTKRTTSAAPWLLTSSVLSTGNRPRTATRGWQQRLSRRPDPSGPSVPLGLRSCIAYAGTERQPKPAPGQSKEPACRGPERQWQQLQCVHQRPQQQGHHAYSAQQHWPRCHQGSLGHGHDGRRRHSVLPPSDPDHAWPAQDPVAHMEGTRRA